MAMTNSLPPSDLSTLPLGLLLGRISGALRLQLLDACHENGNDVRLIGLVLAVQSNPGTTQADYARFLGIDLNTASRLINRAEKDGLIQRVASKSDRRAFALELTNEGRRLAGEGARAAKNIEARLQKDIGEQELVLFRGTAEVILRKLT